jgi:F-type H+-transporting ATPase subunit a
MSAQGHGFQVWSLLHNDFINENPHVAAAAISGGLIVLASLAYRILAPKLNASTKNDADFIPKSNLGIRNFFEMIAEFVQGLARDIIGDHYEHYLPLLVFIFTWTLVNNLLGVIPGFGSSTDNLNTTLAMGLVSFVYYNYHGFKSHGFKYLEHFTGHLHGVLLLFMGPAMFVIELISHSVRPITLGMRLRANMYADHTVHGIVVGLFQQMGDFLTAKLGAFGTTLGYMIAAVGPVPIILLGLLVCVLQAFVFTLLTTIYVGMATAHDDH